MICGLPIQYDYIYICIYIYIYIYMHIIYDAYIHIRDYKNPMGSAIPSQQQLVVLGAAGVVQQELLSTESLHHPMEPHDLTRRDLGLEPHGLMAT